jgi:hypothetical protein
MRGRRDSIGAISMTDAIYRPKRRRYFPLRFAAGRPAEPDRVSPRRRRRRFRLASGGRRRGFILLKSGLRAGAASPALADARQRRVAKRLIFEAALARDIPNVTQLSAVHIGRTSDLVREVLRKANSFARSIPA